MQLTFKTSTTKNNGRLREQGSRGWAQLAARLGQAVGQRGGLHADEIDRDFS